MTAGLVLALAFSFGAFPQYSAFFSGVLLLAVVGLLDDLGEVSPGTKLLLQVIAALLMTSWGENFLVNLGDLFGTNPINTRYWAIPITVLATLAVVNAINMLDGLDGLAGSLVLGIVLVLTGYAWMIGDANAAKVLVVLAGAMVGFLFFNLPWPGRGRHRTFMGDAGSMVLGFAVAWFSVALSQRPGFAVPPPVMLWVLGIVLMDVFTVTVRRLARRRSPMAADRDHIHHMLLRRGFGPWQTLGILVGANLLLAAARHRDVARRRGRSLDLLVVPAGLRDLLRPVLHAVPALSPARPRDRCRGLRTRRLSASAFRSRSRPCAR